MLANCLQQLFGEFVHGEMVPEISSQFPVLSSQQPLPLGTGTENWFSAMLSANVGNLSLGGQISAARHARLVLRADGDGVCRTAGSQALHAASRVRTCSAGRDALSSVVPQSEAPQPDASFQATSDDCCKTHCCCGATTSEWGSCVSSAFLFESPARACAPSAERAPSLERHLRTGFSTRSSARLTLCNCDLSGDPSGPKGPWEKSIFGIAEAMP